MQREIHTPEGMRDVYGSECRKKKMLLGRLASAFHTFGYEDIETPVIEYFDVFSREVGTIPSRELYKFFDRNGDTLALRPDFTPSIARAVSMYFHDARTPIRLCCQGKTFINRSSYQGRLDESTQIGAECLGDGSAAADAEQIALGVRALLAVGLKEFQFSIGEINYFKALVDEAGLDEERELALRKRISHKNHFGVEELLDNCRLSQKLREAFRVFPQLFGGPEILTRAKAMTDNAAALAAVDRLEEIYEVLKLYGVEQYVSFDLSMLSKYRYYTGIIFQGFTYGVGEPVVKGGRYDHLLEHFGAAMPAVGFALVMEDLLNALDRQNIPVDLPDRKHMIVYDRGRLTDALALAAKERAKGISCSCAERNPQLSDKEYGEIAARKGAALSMMHDKPEELWKQRETDI